MEDYSDIRWIAFDAVGTLIHAVPTVAGVYHQIGSKFGSRLTVEEVGTRFREIFGRRIDSPDLTCSEPAEEEFWRGVVAEVLPDVKDPESCFAELHGWFAQPSAWQCYDDVQSTLRDLAQRGYRIAMASNFDARLHSVRSGTPELQRVEVCVVSSEAGWRKPHASFFGALSDACRCPPEKILMVGDDLQVDVVGARRAGLRSVLLNRIGSADAIETSRMVRSLSDLKVRLPGHKR